MQRSEERQIVAYEVCCLYWQQQGVEELQTEGEASPTRQVESPVQVPLSLWQISVPEESLISEKHDQMVMLGCTELGYLQQHCPLALQVRGVSTPTLQLLAIPYPAQANANNAINPHALVMMSRKKERGKKRKSVSR